VIERESPDYESVRRGLAWNGRLADRYPDVIARPRDDDEVVEAIAYAREHGLRIAVRSGGHSWCGAFMRSGGMLLDMGAFNQVAASAAAERTVAGPGVRSQELLAALTPHGRAFPAGHCPTETELIAPAGNASDIFARPSVIVNDTSRC